jgi:hypothetical protein
MTPAGAGRGARRRPRVDRAALAANWRQVLAVDAVLGLVVLAAGVAVSVLASVVVGASIAVLAAAYLVLGVLRWRRWARLRADAGLDAGGGPVDGR